MKMHLWRYVLCCGTLLICFACTQKKIMTYEQYHQLVIGEDISDVQFQAGRPYEIKKLKAGMQEYVYIERISLGEHRELFRRYILTVQNGKVVEKHVVEESSSPIQFYSQ